MNLGNASAKASQRRVFSECIHFAAILSRMSAIKGRARRPENTPTVLFQARVNSAIREEVNAAATASGVSSGMYLEALLLMTLEAEGQLPVLDLFRPRQEELPIPAA